MDNKTPNRFAGGCKVNPKADAQRKGLDDLTYVKDIRWYPQKKTMVIEKSNRTSLTVDLSVIVGENIKTEFPIKVAVWNPDKEPEPGYDLRVVVQKDVEFTDAIQKIVDTISSDNSAVFRTNVSKVAQDVVDANKERLTSTKHDILANIYDESGETPSIKRVVLVESNTDITDAMQTIVDKSRLWDVWNDDEPQG